MNRQHRFQRKAMAQQAAEVQRMFAEYERELLNERDRLARGVEDRAGRTPRQPRHR